jgi:hypothetical protein
MTIEVTNLRARGSRHGAAKLTEDAVREIRRRYFEEQHTFDALAEAFNVSPQAIGLVLHRKTWAHVK